MSRVSNEHQRVMEALQKAKTITGPDFNIQVEMVLTDDDRYRVICHFMDMDGWVSSSYYPEGAIGDTPEEAVEAWNREAEDQDRDQTPWKKRG